MSEEFEDESIMFVNDNGEETNFVILDSLKHNDKEYILVTEDPDAEDIEVQILRLYDEITEENEDGESLQLFNTIEDLDELKEVSRLFSEQTEGDEIEIQIVE